MNTALIFCRKKIVPTLNSVKFLKSGHYCLQYYNFLTIFSSLFPLSVLAPIKRRRRIILFPQGGWGSIILGVLRFFLNLPSNKYFNCRHFIFFVDFRFRNFACFMTKISRCRVTIFLFVKNRSYIDLVLTCMRELEWFVILDIENPFKYWLVF